MTVLCPVQPGNAWVRYDNRPASLDWVTKLHGAFTSSQTVSGTSSSGPWTAQTSCSTGYDLAEAIKQFLTATGNEGKSMCEVSPPDANGPVDRCMTRLLSLSMRPC